MHDLQTSFGLLFLNPFLSSVILEPFHISFIELSLMLPIGVFLPTRLQHGPTDPLE